MDWLLNITLAVIILVCVSTLYLIWKGGDW